jgi:hypothetical protein
VTRIRLTRSLNAATLASPLFLKRHAGQEGRDDQAALLPTKMSAAHEADNSRLRSVLSTRHLVPLAQEARARSYAQRKVVVRR